tara:strand:+ start:2544 stop:4556 length:2013 start_codon:yes stop_codon:yes gene_type:complete
MKYIHLLSLFFILLFSQFVLGAGEKVTVTGIGLTADEAIENALTRAVRKSLGSLITSTTEINNDELIEDRIIVVSGGFVKAYEKVGEAKEVNGVWEVTIEAEIEQNDLSKAVDSIRDKFVANPTQIKGQDLQAQALTQLHNRRQYAEMSLLLFKQRLTLTQTHPRYDYDNIAGVATVTVRFATDSIQWDRYHRSCETILSNYAKRTVSQLTRQIPLQSKFQTNQFVSLERDVIGAAEQIRMAGTIPSYAAACSLSALYAHPIQRQLANSWVLWFQVQSSPTATLWKGYLLDTDPTSLFPFLSRSSVLHTVLKDENKKILVDEKSSLRPTLKTKVYPDEVSGTGIFATSSSGVLLCSGADVTISKNGEPVVLAKNINEFWKNNDKQFSDRLNIFITRQPTIYTPPHFSDDLVHKNAPAGTKNVLRILFTRKPNVATGIVPGYTVERQLPLGVDKVGSLKEVNAYIDFNYNQVRLLEYLHREFGTVAQLNLNGPNGTAILTLNDSTFTPDTNFSIFGQIKELQTLNLRDTKGTNSCLDQVELMPSLVTLDLSNSDVDVMGLEKLKSLNRLQTLIMDNNGIDADIINVLARITSLKTLSLKNTMLTNTTLKLLPQMQQLKVLMLDDNAITTDCVKHLSTMKFLTKLSIKKTKISDAGTNRLRMLLPICDVIKN